MYSNEFPAVSGMYLEDFVTRPADAQVAALNARFRGRTFAIHLRMRANPANYSTTHSLNIIGLEFPPASDLEKRARGA